MKYPTKKPEYYTELEKKQWKRISELEAEVEHWKENCRRIKQEQYDMVTKAGKEIVRLRRALEEIIDASGMRDCNDEVAQIAQEALASIDPMND